MNVVLSKMHLICQIQSCFESVRISEKNGVREPHNAYKLSIIVWDFKSKSWQWQKLKAIRRDPIVQHISNRNS